MILRPQTQTAARSSPHFPASQCPIAGKPYLAIDVVVLSEHQEAPEEGCQERVHLVGLALHMGLERTEALIGEHKAGQVPRVGVRGFQDGLQFLLETAQTESFMSAGPAGA